MSSVFKEDALKGRVAFVTGGASGINRGVSEALGAHGAKVFVVSRNEERLKGAVDEMKANGIAAAYATADVRDYAAMEAAMKKCRDAFGGLDVLVNGAAGNFLCPAAALSPNGFKTVVEIDLVGTFNACKAAFDALGRSKHACIINISATLHYAGSPLMTHAAAAKAGVDALTANLAVEWGPLGIRVNGIAPGPIEGTEGMKRLLPQHLKDKMISRIPLQRMGSVGDIGNAAVYLASDAAAYVTGTTLVVDGAAWRAGRLGMDEMMEG